MTLSRAARGAEGAAETSPLLARDGGDAATTGRPRVSLDEVPPVVSRLLAASDVDPARRQRRLRIYVLVVVVVFLAVVETADFMVGAPQSEISERIICENYYSRGQFRLSQGKHLEWGDSPYDCSVNAVQEELAIVEQVKLTLDVLPGILLAVPYGILADRIGRRPVLFISVAALTIQEFVVKAIFWFPQIFPIRLLWATPLLQIAGGGSQVAASMLFTMLADVISAESRASVFALAQSTILLSDLVGTNAATLMTQRWSPWVPSLVSGALFTLSVLILLFFMPETLPAKAASPVGDSLDGPDDADLPPLGSTKFDLSARLRALPSRVALATAFLFKDYNILLLLHTAFLTALGRQSNYFQRQYVHKLVGWPFAKASSILSIVRSGTSLAVLLIVFPLASVFVTRALHLTPAAKDLFLGRGALALWTLGTLALGAAGSVHVLIAAVAVGSVGGGVAVAVRSLITSLVARTHVATLYTAMAVVQGIGTIVVGPIMAASFNWGLEKGGAWIGLPWHIIGALLMTGVLALACIRLGHGGEEERAEEGAFDETVREAGTARV